jgi:hypothetical protein
MTRCGTVPPGWEEHLTAWAKRIRLVVLASVGLCVACYLALYQLVVLTKVWDPCFPDGSPKVLHLLEPLPDAVLGILAYLAEIVLSLIGGEDRWCTAPCTVLALGSVIFCGAAVSVVLPRHPAGRGRRMVHPVSGLGLHLIHHPLVGRR